MCLIKAISYLNKRFKCKKYCQAPSLKFRHDIRGCCCFPRVFQHQDKYCCGLTPRRWIILLCAHRTLTGRYGHRLEGEWETERRIMCPEIHSAAVSSVLCLLVSVGAEEACALCLLSDPPPLCLCTRLCLGPRPRCRFSWSDPGVQREPGFVQLLLWRWGWNALYFSSPTYV